MIYAEKRRYFLWTYHHKYTHNCRKKKSIFIKWQEVIQLSQWCYKIEKHYKNLWILNGQKTG
jgi:hypothetical protein